MVRALKAIRKLLQRKGLPVVKGRPHIKKSTVITHARVPVIKLTAVVPGHRQPVNMDISIGANNGLAAIQTVRRFVRENAALRPPRCNRDAAEIIPEMIVAEDDRRENSASTGPPPLVTCSLYLPQAHRLL